MGPAFSIVLVMGIAAPLVLAIFVAAKFFLSFQHSLLMAILSTLAAGGGMAFALLVQSPFYPAHLNSYRQVAQFMGVGFAVGILAAILTGAIVWRCSRRGIPN
jgi:hypothetical protein